MGEDYRPCSACMRGHIYNPVGELWSIEEPCFQRPAVSVAAKATTDGDDRKLHPLYP